MTDEKKEIDPCAHPPGVVTVQPDRPMPEIVLSADDVRRDIAAFKKEHGMSPAEWCEAWTADELPDDFDNNMTAGEAVFLSEGDPDR